MNKVFHIDMQYLNIRSLTDRLRHLRYVLLSPTQQFNVACEMFKLPRKCARNRFPRFSKSKGLHGRPQFKEGERGKRQEQMNRAAKETTQH